MKSYKKINNTDIPYSKNNKLKKNANKLNFLFKSFNSLIVGENLHENPKKDEIKNNICFTDLYDTLLLPNFSNNAIRKSRLDSKRYSIGAL